MLDNDGILVGILLIVIFLLIGFIDIRHDLKQIDNKLDRIEEKLNK